MSVVLDDAVLDDDTRLLAADRHGALRAVASAGALVRATWAAADDADLASLSGLRPRALVLLARPGAGDAALRIVESLLVATSPVPVLVTTTAPPWLGPLDVVVAAHRGRDGDPVEEALAEAVHRAARRSTHLVLAGPSAGPVAAAAAGRALAVVPRMTLATDHETSSDLAAAGVLATAFRTCAALDLLAVDGARLADALDAEAERDGPRGEAFVNPAKSQALRLAERTPLLWGADPVAGAVARLGAVALAAHAGVVAHADTVEAAAGASALQARLSAGASDAAIFADPFDDPATGGDPPRLAVTVVREDLATRRRVETLTGRSPAPDVLEIDDLDLAGDDPASDALRASVLATRLEFTALYLGLATGAGGVTGAEATPSRTG